MRMRFAMLVLIYSAACNPVEDRGVTIELDTDLGLVDAGDINDWDGGDQLTDWVRIKGGAFEMGSPSGVGKSNEHPRHVVTVPTFDMWRTEVTLAQYRRCVERGPCDPPRADNDYCNWRFPDREDHPVNCIDWRQSAEYCEWVGGRLPTEAEWEYVARGRGFDVTYPWGEASPTCELAIVDEAIVGCGENATWPVCSKPLGNTRQGLCDMTGNVYEWLQDLMHPAYEYREDGVTYTAPGDGSAWESPFWGDFRTMRGGGIGSDDGYRIALRQYHDPAFYYGGLGVRCARSVPDS